jgi:23S rRNA-/tRNA-specific pseudouridylate synthase
LFSTRKIVKKYAALLWGEVNIDEVKRLVDEGKIYQLSRGEILARDIKISDEVQLYLINESLTRHKKDPRIWMCASDEGARQSVRSAETIVSFREVEGSEGFGVSGKKFTKVNFFPLTGRTHQLRLHAKHLGHPILGDTKYGFGGIDNCLDEDKNTRLHLHATSLEFELNGEKYFFESYPSF